MGFILSFLILFSFWILLSGHFDFLHLFLGVICSALVTSFSHDLLVGKFEPKPYLKRAWRFASFLPWLLFQIIVANLDVAYRTLHPKMPIEPEILKFQTDLGTVLGKVTLANSITLTPGTVTIDIREGWYIVHAISKGSAESLLRGDFQARVKKIEA